MAYICQNCGVVTEDSDNLCNPINEEYKRKSCSVDDEEICEEKISEMQYSCECGNVSAHPQHLCRPKQMH